jgi:hypothetical protein
MRLVRPRFGNSPVDTGTCVRPAVTGAQSGDADRMPDFLSGSGMTPEQPESLADLNRSVFFAAGRASPQRRRALIEREVGKLEWIVFF